MCELTHWEPKLVKITLKSYGKSYPEPPGTHVAKVLNIILRPYFEHVGTSGDNTIVDKKINFPQSFFFNFYFF